ncbi:MAG: OmpA family protein [Burkholderiaceae bacterium]|jgi:OOP family OmpA-OmpF porin|nr:OmpA family protein [Burkholderiaceae bacterium]
MNCVRFNRAILAAALAASAITGLAWAPAASAQAVILAPPRARYEAVPHYRRPGYAWRAGYWGWAHSRYVWVPGYWIAAAPPAYYIAPPVYYAAPRYAAAPPQPAPPAQPAPVAQVIRLPADALFHFDRGGPGDLLPGGVDAISDAASRLHGLNYSRIEVHGYTDRLGSAQHNATLSRQRAETVRAMLIRDGVPADHISAVGMGSSDPVSQCGSQSRNALIRCLQPDRRVEIVVYSGS